jgi:hypothetical protein
MGRTSNASTDLIEAIAAPRFAAAGHCNILDTASSSRPLRLSADLCIMPALTTDQSWLEHYAFIAVWLEAAALIAIFVWDRVDAAGSA